MLCISEQENIQRSRSRDRSINPLVYFSSIFNKQMFSESDRQVPTPDSRLPTPDSRLPTPDSRFPIPQQKYGTTLTNPSPLSR
ncbi:hypothetical protein [Moorena producens]|uniref:hypothetical protein n=1 Tax=Moorena producens TaxID=1155739 RepID=UPI003C786852